MIPCSRGEGRAPPSLIPWAVRFHRRCHARPPQFCQWAPALDGQLAWREHLDRRPPGAVRVGVGVALVCVRKVRLVRAGCELAGKETVAVAALAHFKGERLQGRL